MAYFDFDVTALSAEAGDQVFEFLGIQAEGPICKD